MIDENGTLGSDLIFLLVVAAVQVNILSQFVNKLGVKRDQIVVLTQYRAQQKMITELLKAKGFSDKNVSTVVLSQGQLCEKFLPSCCMGLTCQETAFDFQETLTVFSSSWQVACNTSRKFSEIYEHNVYLQRRALRSEINAAIEDPVMGKFKS